MQVIWELCLFCWEKCIKNKKSCQDWTTISLEICIQLRTFVVLHVFSLGPQTDLNLFLWKQHSSWKKTHPWFQRAFYPSLIFYKLKKESTSSSSNKRTKTLYRDYLHCIASCAIFSKEIISTKTTPNVENKF